MIQTCLDAQADGVSAGNKELLQEECVCGFVFTKQTIWFPYNKNV